MSNSQRGTRSADAKGEVRTAAILVVHTKGSTEGGGTASIDLEHRFELMSCAVKAVRKSDGIAASGLGDAMVGCFEGASAADEAHQAATFVLDAVKQRHADDARFPGAALGLDLGPVHFLRYADGLPLDPQGKTVERARQLAMTTPAGAALATATMRERLSAKDDWKGLPKVPIARLEGERIYQLKGYGEAFKWKPTIVVEAERYDQLRDRLDDYQYQLVRKDAQIKRLEQLMRDITGDIDAETGELTRILTDAKTEELRCRVGDLHRAQLEALLPLLADGAARFREVLERQQRVAQLVAELQSRYPDQEWSDVDFWIRLLAIPTSDPDE